MVIVFLHEIGVAEHAVICRHGAGEVVADTNVAIVTVHASIRSNVPRKITATYDLQVRRRVGTALTEHLVMAAPAAGVQRRLGAIDTKMAFTTFKSGMASRKRRWVGGGLPFTDQHQNRSEKQGQQQGIKQDAPGGNHRRQPVGGYVRCLVLIDKHNMNQRSGQQH